MARKDYPWRIPDIKFGSNLIVNIILLVPLLGIYLIMGIMTLLVEIFPLLNSSGIKSRKFDTIPKDANGRWLVLVNDKACDYAKCFREKGCIYVNTRTKVKPTLFDTVYIYTVKGKRVRFKTVVEEVDVPRQDDKYWSVPCPEGLTCKLKLMAEYNGFALCESNLRVSAGFEGLETIEYPTCYNVPLLDYIEKHFNETKS